jgi:hypothetical protein
MGREHHVLRRAPGVEGEGPVRKHDSEIHGLDPVEPGELPSVAMVDEFPAGSLGAPSAAKAEIDRSREEFAALARHLESLAAALSSAADRAPDGITQSMRMAPGTAMGSSLLGKRAGGAGCDDEVHDRKGRR